VSDRAYETGGERTVGSSPRSIAVLRRFGWGLGDQLLSSLTNFVLGALVARAVSPSEFGAFSLAYATFTLALGATRAVVGEALVVRYSSVEEREWRAGVRLAGGSALTLGSVIGLGCLVAGQLISGPLTNVLLILGISLPGLVLQDAWRYAFFAAGRGSAAFVSDLVWGLLMLLGFVVLQATASTTVSWFTFTWAAAGCAALLVELILARVIPGPPRSIVTWLRRQRDLSPRFTAEFALSSGVANIIVFGIGSVAGLAAVGQLRAGQIALGPLNVLFVGAALVTVPEGVRLLNESASHLVHASRWISGLVAVAAALWGVAVFLLPTSIGELILGANWQGANAIVVPLTIGAVCYGLAFGPTVGLRSLAAARRSLRALRHARPRARGRRRRGRHGCRVGVRGRRVRSAPKLLVAVHPGDPRARPDGCAYRLRTARRRSAILHRTHGWRRFRNRPYQRTCGRVAGGGS
jgi:O-antigen/teichoic acid export membrane protein